MYLTVSLFCNLIVLTFGRARTLFVMISPNITTVRLEFDRKFRLNGMYNVASYIAITLKVWAVFTIYTFVTCFGLRESI